jgi:ABC-2 type transport system ATP-binding protein
MSDAVLELIEVSKHFRSNWTFRATPAVTELSLAMQAGEVYGLIGHNGAGKTTTFKLVVGLLRPTRGTLLWEGQRLEWNSRRTGIGFSPEQPYFYDYLTVGETLELYAQLYGMSRSERRPRITQLVESFRIGHKLNAPMRTLSKGTLQRVAVAQAILHRPRLAILDEPMSGLDPSGRKEMRELIAGLKRDGTAVLFSSHILSDAEALCDRVAILASGRVREVVNLATEVAPPLSYTMVVTGASGLALEVLGRIATEPPAGGPLRWNVKLRDQSAVRSALVALHGTEAAVEAVLPERPSLEQRFLRHANGNGAAADE